MARSKTILEERIALRLREAADSAAFSRRDREKQIAASLEKLGFAAFTLNEAAKQIAASRRFLEKQIALGRLRCIRLSPRCVRIRPEDLADYLERNAV